MKGLVKLIFPIKHCVLSATTMSFLRCLCKFELSEWKKGFKSVCESCVRLVLILFTSLSDSKKVSKRKEKSGNIKPNIKCCCKRQKIYLDKNAHQLDKKTGRARKNKANRNTQIARENDQVAI